MPARVGEPRRRDRVDRRLPPRLGRATRPLRAVRGAHERGRRVSLDLHFERLIAAPPERVFDAFTHPEGQREFYGQDAPGWVVDSQLRPARRRRLVDLVRPGPRPALPPPPRVRGDRTAAPDPDRLDRDPARRLELRDQPRVHLRGARRRHADDDGPRRVPGRGAARRAHPRRPECLRPLRAHARREETHVQVRPLHVDVPRRVHHRARRRPRSGSRGGRRGAARLARRRRRAPGLPPVRAERRGVRRG